MRITTEELRERIGWDRIEDSTEGGTRWVRILPDQKDLPEIQIAFELSGDDCFVWLVSFGGWHTHFDPFEDESEKLDQAIAMVRELISGDRFIVERRDLKGKCVAATDHGPHGPGQETGIPRALVGGQQRTRQILFNQPITKGL